MVITPDMVREAYKVAKRVYEQETSRQSGINDLAERVKFNPSSAADAVDNFKALRDGEGFERKNNLFAARHFLEMIHRDYGVPALRKALDALERHLDYYEGVSTGGRQPGQRRLLAEFRVVADQQGEARGPDGQTGGRRSVAAQEQQDLQTQGVFDPADLQDGRERSLANVVRRRGQSEFRDRLLAFYDRRCAVSGCSVEAVLEAAHITPYLGPETDHPTNGLILRADIHTLFDLGLVGVDPKTMTILVSPTLDGSEYEAYRGGPFPVPTEASGRPSPASLDRHRKRSEL